MQKRRTRQQGIEAQESAHIDIRKWSHHHKYYTSFCDILFTFKVKNQVSTTPLK